MLWTRVDKRWADRKNLQPGQELEDGVTFSIENWVVPGEDTPLPVRVCTRKGFPLASYTQPQAMEATTITLHETSGYGNFAGMMGGNDAEHPSKVGAHFMVGRDGNAYLLVPVEKLCWHANAWSVHSVGIEIDNIGALYEKDGNLHSEYGASDIYCAKSDTGVYLEKDFAGVKYWATLTSDQYDCTARLIKAICHRLKIPRYIQPEPDRFTPLTGFPAAQQAKFRGIMTHYQVNPTNRSDIGPYLDWDRLIHAAGLTEGDCFNAPEYSDELTNPTPSAAPSGGGADASDSDDGAAAPSSTPSPADAPAADSGASSAAGSSSSSSSSAADSAPASAPDGTDTSPGPDVEPLPDSSPAATPVAATTAPPPATTAAPATTQPPESTTEAPAASTTGAPAASTTAPAASTTAAPASSTTAAPSASTTAPGTTTTAGPAASTTAAPGASTTAAPGASTSAAHSTTAAAHSTTAAPTTAAPATTTTKAPAKTTTKKGKAAAATTTKKPAATTTAKPPPTTTTAAPATTTTAAPATTTTAEKPPTVQLYRAATVLKLVPFSPIDDPDRIDAALPDNLQNIAADTRPPAQNAAFAFPKIGEYADNAAANKDASLFRLRINDVPASAGDGDITLNLKVLASDGTPLDAINGVARYKGFASHKDGMAVVFKKKGATRVWESPYMRVATSLSDRNKTNTNAVVHSLWPDGSEKLEHGKQFGRKLSLTGTVGKAKIDEKYTLGGKPYATVPVKFFYVHDAAPAALKIKTARNKLFQLNAWWASQGLEFKLNDEKVLLEQNSPPPRTLIAIGDFTGKKTVSNHPFQLRVELSITKKGAKATPVRIDIPIQADQTATQAAASIKKALTNWSPAAKTPIVGLKLDADVFDLLEPRALLAFPALDLSKGAPNSMPIKFLGDRGPADVVIKKADGNAMELSELTITALSATNKGAPDVTVDFNAPPMNKPFHDALIVPPAATHRQWVRHFSPKDKNFVSVVIESNKFDRYANGDGYPWKLANQGFSTLFDATEATMKARFSDPLNGAFTESRAEASTLMNFGLWTEPHARLIFFVSDSVFNAAKNEVQHEMGHTLADLDHTIFEPSWFYRSELMFTGGPAKESDICFTSYKIYVDYLVKQKGLKGTYKMLPNGYGGAVRARIHAIMPKWETNALADGQTPWIVPA